MPGWLAAIPPDRIVAVVMAALAVAGGGNAYVHRGDAAAAGAAPDVLTAVTAGYAAALSECRAHLKTLEDGDDGDAQAWD